MMNNNHFDLDVGDALLVYTDGITEAWGKGSIKNSRDPATEMFGETRLKQIFSETGSEAPDVIKDAILKNLEDYICDDDVTMVVLKRI